MMVHSQPNSTARLYSVPRRFDLATIMVVTFSFAVLFAGLRMLQLRPTHILKPRLSSVLVGMLGMVGFYAFYAITSDPSLFEFHRFVLAIWLMIAIAGGVAGYLAGVAVGSVFLVSDLLRNSVHSRIRHHH